MGYLATSKDGGWFVPAKSTEELVAIARAIATKTNIDSFEKRLELTASEVPKPY